MSFPFFLLSISVFPNNFSTLSLPPRYELHQKLVNFRVPIPTNSWHEEMISELFNNLFGQKNSHQATGAAQEEDDVVPSEDERIF